MALKITWENNNIRPVEVEIYRSLSTIDRTKLPTPIKVVTDGATSYVDAGAEMGNTYYYVLAVKEGNSRVFSQERKVKVEVNRGAGPSKLIWGDERYGYYGMLTTPEFLSYGDIYAAALTPVLPASPTACNWHKFIRHNKIIYVPDRRLGQCRWTELYSAGFVFGVDGPGPANMIGALTPVNQKQLIFFQGSNYFPRLMRGYWDKYEDLAKLVVGDVPPITPTSAFTTLNPLPGSTNHDNLPNTPNNEWNDFIYPQVVEAPAKSRAQIVSEKPTSTFIGLISYYTWATSTCNNNKTACQERVPGASNIASWVMCRGHNHAQSGTYSVENPAGFLSRILGHQGNHSETLAWVPVIELDETSVVAF